LRKPREKAALGLKAALPFAWSAKALATFFRDTTAFPGSLSRGRSEATVFNVLVPWLHENKSELDRRIQMIKMKRVYDPVSPEDGKRLLVDRLWPRGLTKEKARVDEWMKELAPSNELRTWYSHDPAKWEEFRKRYIAELRGKPELKELMDRIRSEARKGTITLLFSSKEVEHGNAAVLKELLGKA
jgi:uncharacterized protein YeaO (DUF488 family)